ncbi:MAG: N,N-dimethylformamidase beta subunit family domain-containing protein [Candidatus Limnocylindrales bacterium]
MHRQRCHLHRIAVLLAVTALVGGCAGGPARLPLAGASSSGGAAGNGAARPESRGSNPGSATGAPGGSALAPAAGPGGDIADQPGETEDASLIGDRPTITFRGDATWQLQRPSTPEHPTEAYTDAPSYLPGQTLRLAVSTDAAGYTVAIFRLGATVQAMGDPSPVQPGVRQGGPIVDPVTKMVRAGWRVTYSQPIPLTWPSGVYLAKVSSIGGTQSYATFVVRSIRASRLLFVSNTLDYAAYNRWGGSSLYWTSVGDPAPGVHAAVAVSLDRPFADESGAGQIFMLEAPFIAWLEGHGYDVTYTTDYDLSTHPADQPLPRAVLFSGHGEYWGAPLRDWLDQHVLRQGDLGLGLFAADTGYWQVSFSDPSATGLRTIGLYKDARFDPALPARCPGGFTSHANAFRSLPCGVGHRTGNRPEQALFGVQYGDVVPGYYAYRLAAGAPARLLAGTGLVPGDSLGQIAGGEVDRVFPGLAGLPGDHLFAATMTVTRAGASVAAQAVVRALPSGGRVFASGTFWWGWGLEPSFAASHGVPAGFGQLTDNLLGWLAGG